MRALRFVMALGLLCSAVAVLTAADAGPNPAPRRERAKPPVAVTAQQEAEVLQFLRQHHTELAELLSHLQLSRPADYSRAIRDIGHARERLRQFEKGDGERYELELQSWVLQSKIQLLVARLAMSDSESLRDELRHLLADQFELKLRFSQIERDRTAERLQKLDEQLRRLTDSRAELLEKEFLSLTKSSEKLKAKRKEATAAKPAGKSTP
jgi:hypothetical protein